MGFLPTTAVRHPPTPCTRPRLLTARTPLMIMKEVGAVGCNDVTLWNINVSLSKIRLSMQNEKGCSMEFEAAAPSDLRMRVSNHILWIRNTSVGQCWVVATIQPRNNSPWHPMNSANGGQRQKSATQSHCKTRTSGDSYHQTWPTKSGQCQVHLNPSNCQFQIEFRSIHFVSFSLPLVRTSFVFINNLAFKFYIRTRPPSEEGHSKGQRIPAIFCPSFHYFTLDNGTVLDITLHITIT